MRRIYTKKAHRYGVARVEFKSASIEQMEAILAVTAKINAANEIAKEYKKQRARSFS
jgi:hypothetical protein